MVWDLDASYHPIPVYGIDPLDTVPSHIFPTRSKKELIIINININNLNYNFNIIFIRIINNNSRIIYEFFLYFIKIISD